MLGPRTFIHSFIYALTYSSKISGSSAARTLKLDSIHGQIRERGTASQEQMKLKKEGEARSEISA